MRKLLHLLSKQALLLCLFLVTGMMWGQSAIIPKLFLSSRNVPSGNTGWIISAVANNAATDYWKMLAGTNSMTSPEMNFSTYSDIKVTLVLQSFGSIANNSDKIKVEYFNGSTWNQVGSLLATSSSQSTPIVSFPSDAISSNAKIRITAPNATSSVGARVYSIEIKGSAPTFSVPAVTNTTATNISTTSATFAGNVTATGGSAILANGTVYSVKSANANPQLTGLGVSNLATSSPAAGIGTFSNPSGAFLSPNVQYSYNAYATNTTGTGYGTVLDFWTLANVPATPTVNGAEITSLNVSLNATDSNPVTTQYAIYELNTDKYVQANGSLGSSEVWNTIASWTSTITVNGLAPTTSYDFYVKARNGANVATGFSVGGASGTTLVNTIPTLESDPLTPLGATCINASAAIQTLNVLGVNLTLADVTIGPLAGFTFSVDGVNFNPEAVINADGNGDLIEEVLVKFTPTFAQSYNGNIPVSGGGAATINVNVVASGINTPPTVTSPTSTLVTVNTATLGGNITVLGCSAVTTRGIEYSTTNNFAIGAGTIVSESSSSYPTGVFTVPVTGLTSNTVYYYKAFVTSSGGTAYSVQSSFKTLIDYCAGDHFYDTGGISGSYSSNENITTVITPSSGNLVTVTFNSFNTESTYDFLKVYDGPNVSAPALHTGDGFSGTTIPGPFTSTHPSGTLTFVFTSDVSNTGSGWDATVTCNPLPTCIKPTSLNTSLVTSISVKLNWTASLSNPTDGYDYYYDTSSTAPIESTIASGNVGAEENSVTLSTLSSATTYYYWVRANCGSDDYSEWAAGGSFTTAQLSAPVATAAQEITATGFTANWNAVDGASAYALDVYEKSEVNGELMNEEFTWTVNSTGGNDDLWSGSIASTTLGLESDLPNWNLTTAYKANNAIKAGSGSNQGIITTPPLNFTGNGLLTFRAGAWNGTNEQTQLRVEITGGGTLNLSQVTLIKGAFSNYEVQISNATVNTKITFKGFNASNSRFFLDDVKINGLVQAISYVDSYTNFNTGNVTSYTVTGLEPEKDYYYVVRAVNGTTSPNSNEITVTTAAALTSTTWNGTAWSNTIGPDATIDAIINGDYAETTDITAKNLTINTGFTLNVKPTNTLTVAGNLVNNGSIVFESTATGTARFAEYTGAAISGTGTTTVERYIPAKRAWRLLTAPLKGSANNSIFANWQNNGANSDGLTGILLWNSAGTATPTAVNNGLFLGPQANMRTFNAGAWTDVSDTNATTLFSANGNNAFLVFSTGPHASSNIASTSASTTARATGSLITGTVSHTLVANQFKMIANPFASPLNTIAMFGHNPANTKMWVIDPSIGLGAYVTYDGLNWSTTPTGNGINIQSGQAFFVRNAVAGTFEINEADKVSGNSNNWVEKTSTEPTSDKIRVQLFKQVNATWSIADGILAVNNSEGNNSVDAQDASKISNFSENILFKNGTSNLAIEYRNLPQSGAIQAMHLTATTAIPYQLRLFTEGYTNSTLQPYLEDTQTGTFTEIPTDGAILTVPFTGVAATSTTPDTRFRIVYQTNLSTNNPTLLNVSVFPNPVVNSQFNINLGTITNAKYTITNLLGQSIQQGVLASSQNTISIPSLTKGIYILRVNQESKSYTTKIYVQ